MAKVFASHLAQSCYQLSFTPLAPLGNGGTRGGNWLFSRRKVSPSIPPRRNVFPSIPIPPLIRGVRGVKQDLSFPYK
jgi:hypothetical protein